MDYRKIKKIEEDLDLLMQGKDPQTRIKFSEDTILNSNYNKNLFKELYIFLNKFLKEKVGKKEIFQISNEMKEKIILSENPIPISTFVYSINKVIDTFKMKKLKATQITSWLLKKGYLDEKIHEDGKKFKILTDKAKEIGMTKKTVENSYGRIYDINLYSRKAQEFILNNLNKIILDEFNIFSKF